MEIKLLLFDKEKAREYEKADISSNESDALFRNPILDSSRKRSRVPKEESGKKDPLLRKRPRKPKGLSNKPLQLKGNKVINQRIP